MRKFYKEFALKKVLECGGAEYWKKVKVGKVVYLNDLDEEKFKYFSKQVGVSIDKKGKKSLVLFQKKKEHLLRTSLIWDGINYSVQ